MVPPYESLSHCLEYSSYIVESEKKVAFGDIPFVLWIRHARKWVCRGMGWYRFVDVLKTPSIRDCAVTVFVECCLVGGILAEILQAMNCPFPSRLLGRAYHPRFLAEKVDS